MGSGIERGRRLESVGEGQCRPVGVHGVAWLSRLTHDAPLREVLARCEHSVLDVGSLTLCAEVRSASDPKHVALLAEVADVLPPVLVHGPSGRVLDGAHRVQAARLAGRATISALVYNGSFEDGFVIAVRINGKHGLPLSRRDRVAAVTTIIQSHESWSDRMIADVAGVAPSTVCAVRRKIPFVQAKNLSRTGRDGRMRPVDGAVGRERATDLWKSSPDSTIREIARQAGVSPATARDVRNRVRAGLDPMRRRPRSDSAPQGQEPPESRERHERSLSSLRRDEGEESSHLAVRLDRLMKDPSMRQTDAGRNLLRLLDVTKNVLCAHEQLVDGMPDHCAWSVCDLARQYAAMWENFADKLEVRKPRVG